MITHHLLEMVKFLASEVGGRFSRSTHPAHPSEGMTDDGHKLPVQTEEY